LSIAGYTLQDDYNPSKFFDMFDAFTGSDPTDGFVKFVDMQTGKSNGLMTSSSSSVKLAADSTNVTPGGRPAVRLTSKNTYSEGLFIADIAHMPGSICGAWPAFWTFGPDWPNNGEIDIIEGVNSATSNSMTLHTASGCSINDSGFSGTLKTANCFIDAAGQGNNVGCGIGASQQNTYGDPFNAAGGGVYATEWTSQHIAIYFFSRSNIPADITSGNPNPAGWGQPAALFAGGCNIPQTFKNHSIIFDTTFCGAWAGEVWSSDPVCSKKASTCNDYVQNNPSAFADAYWEVNSVKVYQNNGGYIGASPTPGASSTLKPVPSASSPASKGSGKPSIPASAAVPSNSISIPSSPAVSIPAVEQPAVNPAASTPAPAAPSAAPSVAPSPDAAAPPSSSGIPIPFHPSGGRHHHPRPSGSPAPSAMMETAAIPEAKVRSHPILSK
jgi:hypothetical protein